MNSKVHHVLMSLVLSVSDVPFGGETKIGMDESLGR
jgi:hypothetical protein